MNQSSENFDTSDRPIDIVELLKEHRDRALREAKKYPIGSIIYQQYQISASMIDSIIGPVLKKEDNEPIS